MIRLTLASMAGLGLAACTPTPPPALEQAKTVEDKRFDVAANFTCEGGVKLDVLFNQGDGSAVLARVDGAMAVQLMVDAANSTDRMIWKDANVSLAVGGADASWTSGGVAKACTFAPRSLPPPKAEGVVQTLMAEDAGKSVTVKVGEKVAIALSGVPTAGYVWGAATPPAWVKASDGPGGATSTSQFLPGFAGGSHWEVVIVEATAAGEGEITLAQRRPWESTAEPDAATFKFTLKAS